MTGTTEQIEAAAHRFNVAKCDLKYLTAHNSSPGILEMLNAGDDYEYFGLGSPSTNATSRGSPK